MNNSEGQFWNIIWFMIGLRVFWRARLVNFGKVFQPKLLPGGSNLNCLSCDRTLVLEDKKMSIWLLAHD